MWFMKLPASLSENLNSFLFIKTPVWAGVKSNALHLNLALINKNDLDSGMV